MHQQPEMSVSTVKYINNLEMAQIQSSRFIANIEGRGVCAAKQRLSILTLWEQWQKHLLGLICLWEVFLKKIYAKQMIALYRQGPNHRALQYQIPVQTTIYSKTASSRGQFRFRRKTATWTNTKHAKYSSAAGSTLAGQLTLLIIRNWPKLKYFSESWIYHITVTHASIATHPSFDVSRCNQVTTMLPAIWSSIVHKLNIKPCLY